MRKCFFWETESEPRLKVAGYFIGWLGAIYRSLASLAVATELSSLPDDDNLYIILYSLLLGYCFISLAAEFLLIVGIGKQSEKYLIPYLGIHGIEIFVFIQLFIAGIVVIVKKNCYSILVYFIPCGVVLVSAYILFWSLLLRLFNDFKTSPEDTISTQSQNSASSYPGRCSCSCFRSDSLDIVT